MNVTVSWDVWISLGDIPRSKTIVSVIFMAGPPAVTCFLGELKTIVFTVATSPTSTNHTSPSHPSYLGMSWSEPPNYVEFLNSPVFFCSTYGG